MTNFDIVENAIQTSMGAEGSALKENQKYLESVKGKTEALTRSTQEYWNELINSEVIKYFIDAAQGVVDFANAFGPLKTTLAGVLAYFMAFKKVNPMLVFKGFMDQMANYGNAQTSLKGLSTSIGVTGLNPEQVTAYAAAVKNLTFQKQAAMLATQGLSEANIEEVLTQNQATDADLKAAMAQPIVAKNTKNLVISKEMLKTANLSEAASNFLLENSGKKLTAGMLREAVQHERITKETQEEIAAKFTLVSTNTKVAASAKGIWAATKLAISTNPVGFILTIISTIAMLFPIVERLHTSTEELAQEAEQLKNAYDQVADGIKNNISTIGGLEEEFNRLSKGVNNLGENVSLSADDYARYQEIVQQLVGISPSLISGYDEEGKALANKNGLIERSIELMEKQQQIEARKLTTGDTGKTLQEDIASRYKDIETKKQNKENTFKFMFGENMKSYIEGYEASSPGNWASDIFKEFMSEEEASEIFDGKAFASKYYDAIIEDLNSGNSKLEKYIGTEHADATRKFVSEYEENMRNFADELESVNREYNEYLAQKLVGMEDYYNLSKESRGYASSYVMNLDVNSENFESKVKEVENFVKFLNANSESVSEVFGIGAKAVSKTDSNGNTLTFEEYKKQIDDFKAELQSDATFDDTQKSWILNTLGLGEDGAIEKELDKQINHIKGLLKESDADVDSFVNKLSTTDLELALSITAEEGSDTMSIDELEAKLASLRKEKGIDIKATVTYSTISESVEKYNAAIEQTNEVMGSGTEVTEDYKKSLIELGISEEELNEHFYEENKLMVKNEKGLKKLVTAAKNNIASNLKLSKAQAELKYYDLVKEMGKAINGKNQLDNATMQNVRSMMQEADSVRQSIIQYKRLEDELNNVSNAFTKFNEAKEIDALNTKPDTFLEAVNLMQQTITQTGEFGTESFWAAVDMTIPPEVYQGLETDVQKIEAIISYFNSDVKKLLTIGEDDIQIDFDTMERFFNEMNSKGLLKEGSVLGDFEFADEIKNLDDLSEAMGLTKDQLQAMFDAMDKFNINKEALPFALQLDDSLEGRILKTTSALDELQRQKIELLSEGNGGYEDNKTAIDEINKKINETSTSMANLSKESQEHIHSYLQLDTVISKIEELKNLNQELSEIDYDNLGLKNFGITFDEASAMSVQELMDTLLAKKLKLGEPTKLQAQLAIDEIDKQIADIRFKIESAKVAEINGGIRADTTELDAKIASLSEEKINIATQFGIELPEEEKNKVLKDLGEAEEYKIHDKTFFVRANINSAWSALRSLNNYQFAPKVVTVTTSYQGSYRTNDPGRPRVNGTAHVSGTAHANGNWGAPKTEEALTGELGPELRVRGNKWELLGENGAEFNKVKKGDIIFNHKQTKSLLENGYVNSRGKAYASGTALANGLYRPTGGGSGSGSGSGSNGNGSNNSNSSSASEAANDFKEVFDWFEVKLEEINELLELWGAQLENIVDIAGKGAKIDTIIDKNKYKLDVLAQGLKLYEGYTNQLLSEIPAQYREAAKNGQIAIETFAGDAGEKTLEAINNYREWAKKVADVQQQMEELTQTIADLAKQKFDVIDEGYDNKISLMEAQIDRLKDSISLTEDRGNIASSEYYNAMTNITSDRINKLQEEHKLLQESLDKSVEAGDITKYSDRWYEMVEAIYNVDKELMECTSSLEEFQNSINELNWDNFDELINRLDYLYSETDNLIGLMEQSGELINYPKDNEYWGSDDVAWSKEGITSLGLYAQKMEIAEYMSEQYAKAIDNLNKDYNAGKYSMSEYQEKLNELKKSQYDSIKNYYDAQDAIVELNKTRVDAIKTGIEKEIDAYSKLIEKKKEELSVEKDMHDFQKDIAEQQKGISDIERKISALSMDNSASAVAQRKKLEAELAEARSALDESYYDRSIEDQQTALDNELDNFKEQKDVEIEKWEKYLEDVQKVVADSLLTVQTNAIDVYDTLSGKASEYNLTLSDAITLPWQSGSNAVSSYQDTFNTAASSTYEQLGTIKQQWQDIIDLMTKTANIDISNLNADNQSHVAAQKKEPVKQTTPPSNPPTTASKPNVSVGSAVTVKSSATHFATGQRMASFVPGGNYTVYQDNGDRVLIGRDGVYTGWVYKQDIQGYAKGTNGIKKNQLAWIDENGLEELVMHAGPNGRLQYLTKGTSVIPSDISENLMKIGSINPQEILDRNRASVKVNPAVANNNVNINITYGDILHVDNLNGGDTAEIAKIVDARFNKHTKQLNDSLRKYVR